jgi:tetratricopeptide (TPR) repeat protein
MKYLRLFTFLVLLLLLSYPIYAQATGVDYMRAAIEATNKKQYKNAILLCDAAIALNSTSSVAYFHRGYNKLLLKDYKAAIVDLSVCLDLSPDNVRAFLYRGYSNQKAGNSWAATNDYNSARKIDAMETFAFVAGNMFRASLGN